MASWRYMEMRALYDQVEFLSGSPNHRTIYPGWIAYFFRSTLALVINLTPGVAVNRKPLKIANPLIF